jgi:CubicO group peptidase (beta-lactamase class C family)
VSSGALEIATRYAMERSSSAFLVARDGKIIWERYAPGFDERTQTNSMSMAKTILALAVGAAIDQGKISSEEDPVSRYLPDWLPGRHIRIRDLLQMASGLRFDDSAGNVFSDLARMHSASDALSVALTAPAGIPAGTRFEYRNVNALILSKALEAATGERYASYLSHVLWQSIGASDAELWLDHPGGEAKSYCCLFAAPRDWIQVGELLRHQGKAGTRQVISERWIRRMLTPTSLNPDYGYLIWLGGATTGFPKKNRARPFAASDLFYLDGSAQQRVYVVPSKGLVIVRVGERPRDWDDAAFVNPLIESIH